MSIAAVHVMDPGEAHDITEVIGLVMHVVIITILDSEESERRDIAPRRGGTVRATELRPGPAK